MSFKIQYSHVDIQKKKKTTSIKIPFFFLIYLYTDIDNENDVGDYGISREHKFHFLYNMVLTLQEKKMIILLIV